MRKANRRLGSPVRIVPPIQPTEMRREYKRHRWLVYTACTRLATVGWPVAVAEAQAAGVGVCIQNLRPDLLEYVGEAGYLYDDLDDVRRIVSAPFPEDKRRAGFDLARRSDIRTHVARLEALWKTAFSGTVRYVDRRSPVARWLTPRRASLAR